VQRWLSFLIGASALGLGSHAARADGEARVDLTVDTSGFRNAQGQLIVAVFDSKDGWPKLEKALRVEKVKATGATARVTFKGLPTGTYAVEVIHDENANGKLDMRWLPFPKPLEGAGASNDAPASLGPPSFSDARFRLSEKGGVIAIKMRYW
jgi:uncharacterized protein (DUF2141 family)